MLDDADFILELVNTPKWLQHIGKRDVNNLEDARLYLEQKVIPNYHTQGFGFYIMETISDQKRVGNCGITYRTGMNHADIGYSLLPQYEGMGYAFEAAQAILNHGFEIHGLKVIEAIVTRGNERSQHLLGKLGMTYKKMIYLPDDDEELMLFEIAAP